MVRVRDVPGEFGAVLSGHIHRRQVLVRDLCGRRLEVPVLYPGSVERTSLAEIGEPKGFLMLRLSTRDGRVDWEFRDLPARPMVVADIEADAFRAGTTRVRPGAACGETLESRIRAIIAAAPDDSVLRIRIRGRLRDRDLPAVSAASLRRFAPATMNVEVGVDGLFGRGRDGRPGRPPKGGT